MNTTLLKRTPFDAAGIPSLLKQKKTWVNWRLVECDGKSTKVPHMPSGQRASTTNPNTWSTFDAVVHAEGFDGIGVVLTDDIVGIDMDHCLDNQGTLEPWAQTILDRFSGAYIERSPSGTGLHILCRGVPKRNGKGGPENRLEVYSAASPRYFTVTGAVQQYGVIYEAQVELDWLADTFMSKTQVSAPNLSQTATSSVDDSELIKRACQSSPKFARLWQGEDVHEDDSSNDLALCNYLCFWLHGDRGRIDSAFRQSGLMREKWDERRGLQTYGERTIDKAVQDVVSYYMPGGRVEPVIQSGSQTYSDATPLMVPMDFSVELKAPETLIQRYMPREGVGMIWGAPGVYKSFLGIAWALHIATGTPWNECKASRGDAWYLANEGVNGLRRRVEAWVRRKGVRVEEIDGRFFLPTSPIVFNDQSCEMSGEVIRLAALIEAGHPPAVIFVDTFARAMCGDENSAKDAGAFIKAVDFLVSKVRAAGRPVCIVLVHHSRKDAEIYRGSSALRGAIDFEYSLTRRNDAGSELKCLKMKDLEEPPAVFLERHVVPLGCKVDNHGDIVEISSLVLEVGEHTLQDESNQADRDYVHAAALDLVRQALEDGDPFTSKDNLVKALPKAIPREIRRSVVDGMLDSGWLCRVVIDKSRYEILNHRRPAYFSALTTAEHDEYMSTKSIPSHIKVPPITLAVPWTHVSDADVQQAKSELVAYRQKAAAKAIAQVQIQSDVVRTVQLNDAEVIAGG